MSKFEHNPVLTEAIGSPNYGSNRERREGVMLHYDASASDKGSVSWFKHPDCKVSYHWLVQDDGSYVSIVPAGERAWHAGVCRPSGPFTYKDGNSAFFGIAVSATDGEAVTVPQLLTVAMLTRQCFEREGWNMREIWRITGHSTEAWPRGRKTDPEGSDPKRPVLSVEGVRQLVGMLP